MADESPSAEIARLEDEIESLAATIEGCRKYILFSKIAMAAGAPWWVAFLLALRLVRPSWMIASLAAIIGGIVVLGSNDRTMQEAQAEMADAESERAELIGRIDLHVVGDADNETSSVVAFPTRTPSLI